VHRNLRFVQRWPDPFAVAANELFAQIAVIVGVMNDWLVAAGYITYLHIQ